MGIAEMEIRSFGEMHQSAWGKCKKPFVAVYKDPDAIQRPKYLAKVYDGAYYTGIYMRMDDIEKLREDIRMYAHWLSEAKPGADDEPFLLCIYA